MQCFSGTTKHTCQNSAIFEHFQKWPKNLGDILDCSLSMKHTPTILQQDSIYDFCFADHTKMVLVI